MRSAWKGSRNLGFIPPLLIFRTCRAVVSQLNTTAIAFYITSKQKTCCMIVYLCTPMWRDMCLTWTSSSSSLEASTHNESRGMHIYIHEKNVIHEGRGEQRPQDKINARRQPCNDGCEHLLGQRRRLQTQHLVSPR